MAVLPPITFYKRTFLETTKPPIWRLCRLFLLYFFAKLFHLLVPSLRERAEEETLHNSYPAEEDARHFSGKMKKMSFSLEKKEKNIIFASEGIFTFDIGL